ncbi:VOC family protein [bacterium]|nr:VOC family protein [bacterium]
MVKVNDLKFSLIYAEDFEKTKSFYEKHFGFKESFEMNDTDLGPQTWGMTGEVGMWIGGGYKRSNQEECSTRSGVMFGVDSAFTLLEELNKDQVKILQEEPVEMQPGVFWFQFEDPSGNLIEILGGK